MALSKEELLKPRYKVIADWPTNQFLVGDIFTFKKTFDFEPVDGETEVWYDEKNGVFMATLIKYPHLFIKMEWWEERTKEELPKYVKDVEGRMGLLGQKYSHNLKNCVNVTFANGNAVVAHFDNFKPVDEEEYNAYIQKQTTNG